MPSLSPTMSEGGIVEWHKKEGDKVCAGDLICDIQTDKAVVGMEAEEDGTLAKILKPKDTQNIIIGEAIGVMADEGEDWRTVSIPSLPSVAAASIAGSTVGSEKVADKVAGDNIGEAKPVLEKLGPAVRRLLDNHGLRPEAIAHHSGPHSILTKSDVQRHIDQKGSTTAAPSRVAGSATAAATATAPTSRFVDIPLSNMRSAIAKRMSTSKATVPHWYCTGEASIAALLRTREALKTTGVAKLSVNDFVVKACSLALRLVPEINNGLNADGSLKLNSTVDISVAVSSETGLITPIVFGADKLSIGAIHSEIEALAIKARNNKLQPHEFLGGTFTISNLGMFGIKQFTAIINAPQAAILAVGAGIPHLALDDVNSNHQRPSTRWDTRMRFTLCADARVVDELSSASFVNRVKSYLENPDFLLADSCMQATDNHAVAWSY